MLKWMLSRHLWMHPKMLWLLFIFNLLGTLYGYEWYRNQLVYTWKYIQPSLVWFVPDSPTASLFFTIAIGYFLFSSSSKGRTNGEGLSQSDLRQGQQRHKVQPFRSLMESLAFVTSIKYGLWAVVMIVSGAALGDSLNWQHYMLIVSHLAMAVEVILFARWFRFGWMAVTLTGIWTLTNDWIDYTYGVYPALPSELSPYLNQIALFTVSLSIVCIISAVISMRFRSHK